MASFQEYTRKVEDAIEELRTKHKRYTEHSGRTSKHSEDESIKLRQAHHDVREKNGKLQEENDKLREESEELRRRLSLIRQSLDTPVDVQGSKRTFEVLGPEQGPRRLRRQDLRGEESSILGESAKAFDTTVAALKRKSPKGNRQTNPPENKVQPQTSLSTQAAQPPNPQLRQNNEDQQSDRLATPMFDEDCQRICVGYRNHVTVTIRLLGDPQPRSRAKVYHTASLPPFVERSIRDLLCEGYMRSSGGENWLHSFRSGRKCLGGKLHCKFCYWVSGNSTRQCCRTCLDKHQACIMLRKNASKKAILEALPLPPSVRPDDATPGDDAYYINTDKRRTHKETSNAPWSAHGMREP